MRVFPERDPALVRPILFKVSPLLPAIGWGSITLLYAVSLSRKAVLYVLLNVRYFSCGYCFVYGMRVYIYLSLRWALYCAVRIVF